MYCFSGGGARICFGGLYPGRTGAERISNRDINRERARCTDVCVAKSWIDIGMTYALSCPMTVPSTLSAPESSNGASTAATSRGILLVRLV